MPDYKTACLTDPFAAIIHLSIVLAMADGPDYYGVLDIANDEIPAAF